MFHCEVVIPCIIFYILVDLPVRHFHHIFKLVYLRVTLKMPGNVVELLCFILNSNL